MRLASRRLLWKSPHQAVAPGPEAAQRWPHQAGSLVAICFVTSGFGLLFLGGVFYSSLLFLLSVVVFLLAPQRRSRLDGAVTISKSAAPAGCEVVHPPSASH